MNLFQALYIVIPCLIGLWLAHRHTIAVKRITCKHDFNFHGWSYVKCKNCGLVREDEKMNIELQNSYWERARASAPDHPMFTKEAINNELMKRGRASHIVKEPIKWKELIPTNPTQQEFLESWKVVFKHDFFECKVKLFANDLNQGFVVDTPSGSHLNGGFGEHTDSPVNPKHKWYNSGCTWATDENGTRYYKASEKTLLPMYWDEVKATQIIRNFLKANWENVDNFLNADKIAIEEHV